MFICMTYGQCKFQLQKYVLGKSWQDEDNQVYMSYGQCTFQFQKYVLGEMLQAEDNHVYMTNSK